MKLTGIYLNPPATPDALKALQRLLPPGTPRDFIDFFRKTDGAEAAFDPDWAAGEPDTIRIDSVEILTQLFSPFAGRYPHLSVIGSAAATKLIAYDMSQGSPWPIVIFESDTEDYASTFQPLAPDMSSLWHQFFSHKAPDASSEGS